ncbi:MAG TPA: hypothetical protein DEH78_12970 [Solibacterales bacterium]|nr:hypothetical protein [Bryobacterales bacterium]
MKNNVLILVPAYRCEKTIVDTLESIQSQGPRLDEVKEVLVIDDGSHDGIAEVARTLWRSSVPLRIIDRHFNYGEYASVNAAIEAFPPDVDWFLIMHGDNYAKPGWLDEFLNRVEAAEDHVGLIGSSYDSFRDSGEVHAGENKDGQEVMVRGDAGSVASTLIRGCWWHISSCAIRVKAYRQVGGLPKLLQLKGDWDFMLRILAAGWSIWHIPRSLMMYRDNPQGSSSISFRRHSDIFETLTVVLRFQQYLSSSQLFSAHYRLLGFLVRRLGRCIVSLDGVRLAWLLPAAGYVAASYCTAVAERRRNAQKS